MPSLDNRSEAVKHRYLSALGDADHARRMQVAIMSIKDVTLSASQLDTLAATPVELIAAPGAGKAIVVHKVYGFLDFNSTAWAGTSETLDVQYTNGSGDVIATFSETNFIEATADALECPAMIQVVPVVNAAVVAGSDADWTTGDSPIKLTLWYSVITADRSAD